MAFVRLAEWDGVHFIDSPLLPLEPHIEVVDLLSVFEVELGLHAHLCGPLHGRDGPFVDGGPTCDLLALQFDDPHPSLPLDLLDDQIVVRHFEGIAVVHFVHEAVSGLEVA